jgi:hypothetical protein
MGVLPPPSNMFACRTEYKLQGINGVLGMISSNIKQGRYARKELKVSILSDFVEVEEDDTRRSSSGQGLVDLDGRAQCVEVPLLWQCCGA